MSVNDGADSAKIFYIRHRVTVHASMCDTRRILEFVSALQSSVQDTVLSIHGNRLPSTDVFQMTSTEVL